MTAKSSTDSHLAQIFRVGYAELNRMGKSLETRNLLELSANPEVLLENVERAIQGGMTSERQRFERFLPLLATTGSTAPFIGLFGTVWGIMTSFQEIGIKGAANLAVVAPGISEALIATAIGLGGGDSGSCGLQPLFYQDPGNRKRNEPFFRRLSQYAEKGPDAQGQTGRSGARARRPNRGLLYRIEFKRIGADASQRKRLQWHGFGN